MGAEHEVILNWFFTVLLALWVVPCFLGMYNLITWRRADALRLGDRASQMRLSVLIPARNEAHNINDAIASILTASDEFKVLQELIVYDDQSTDETAQIVSSWAARDGRVRLLKGQVLPQGWVGKPHACQNLLEAASGSHVLFLDADVRLKSPAFAILAGLARGDASQPLITAVPQQIMGSPFEAMMLPLLHLTYLAWLPLSWSNRHRNPSFSAACGQIVFVRRSDLNKLGGFGSVGGEVVDDLALVRFAKARGMNAVFVDGFSIATCRMYRSPGALWRGFSKNLYLGVGRPFAFLAALSLNCAAFVLPFVCATWLFFSPNAFGRAGFILVCCGVGANVLLRLLLAMRFSHRRWSVALQPFAVSVLIVIAFNSWRWVSRGAVHWAGRSYVPKKLLQSMEGQSNA